MIFIPIDDTDSSASEIDSSVTTPLVLSNALPCRGAATAAYSRPSSVSVKTSDGAPFARACWPHASGDWNRIWFRAWVLLPSSLALSPVPSETKLEVWTLPFWK